MSVALVATFAGCAAASPGPGANGPSLTSGSELVALPRSEADIYAAVVRQLVLFDHSFGNGPPTPFGQVYVIDSYASRSGSMVIVADGPFLDVELRRGIANQSDEMPPVEFVAKKEDKGQIERQGLTGVENDGVIVGLAPVARQPDGTVHVGAGYWCGLDCGLALTYVVEDVGGHWHVTGKTGPVSIA